MDGWDGDVCYYDNMAYSRAMWTDVNRVPEYEAFGLVLGICRTPLQLIITWERNADRDIEAYQDFVTLAFKTFRYYAHHHPTLTSRAWRVMTARKLSTSAHPVTDDMVREAVLYAEHSGLAEAA